MPYKKNKMTCRINNTKMIEGIGIIIEVEEGTVRNRNPNLNTNKNPRIPTMKKININPIRKFLRR